MTESAPPANRIGRMLVSSRSLAEYRAMFDLTDTDLTRTILDCPGGAASFTAEVNALGGDVTACDPTYTRQADELGALSLEDLDRGRDYHQDNPDEYVWTFFTDAEDYYEQRARASRLFTADRNANPDRYVAASLPDLPFADGQFDLVTMSHLLFSYLDRLDRQFHVDSITELMRVAREARIFPLVPMGHADNPALPPIREDLHKLGFTTTVRAVNYEFQRGGTEMLVVTRG